MAGDPAPSKAASLLDGFLVVLRGWPLVPSVSPRPSSCHSTSSSKFAWGPPHPLSAVLLRLLALLDVDLTPSPLLQNSAWVSSPAPVLISVILYIAAVCFWTAYIRTRGLPPRDKEPWALRTLILLHNIFLCILSAYMGTGLLTEAWRNGYSVWGNHCRPQDKKMAHYLHLFYLSKVYEFMDTAIILMKRNLRQVSYLHVYHHASISVIWCIMCHICPSGDSYFAAAFNSWVHVAMYSYYLLAALVGKDERLRRRYLSWGKYLTLMQIVQFVSFIGQSMYGMLHPGVHPRGMDQLLFYYSLSLLLFFLNFYIMKHWFAPRSTPRPKSAPPAAQHAVQKKTN